MTWERLEDMWLPVRLVIFAGIALADFLVCAIVPVSFPFVALFAVFPVMVVDHWYEYVLLRDCEENPLRVWGWNP